MNQKHFFLGEWEVQPELNRILRNKTKKQLEPQLMKLLLCLVRNKKQLVTKESLIENVWNDVVVTENVLTRAISSLRKELGDSTRNSKYIETISKTGYRLIADVKYTSKTTISKSDQEYARKRKLLLIAVPAFLLLLFSSFSIWKILSPEDSKVFYPVALANNNSTEYYPAISKDGQFAAYASRSVENSNWDIYVKRIGAETLIKLTDNPSVDLRPVWSNDGSNVYHIRYQKEGPTIYKTPMIGGKETRILTAGKFCRGNFDISPAEDEIAYNDRSARGKPLQIELTNLSSGKKLFVTNPPDRHNGDIHPTYSPDGSKIAFIREKNSTSMHLYVLDLSSKELKQITKDHISINGFDWSSDGKSIVYGANKTGLYKLWKVNIQSLKSTLLPISDDQMVMPRISENDKTIYAKLQDIVNIWSYSLNSKEAKTWRATKKLDLNPSYSFDGSKVAFITNQSGSYQLWVSGKNHEDPIKITNFEGQYINTPRWSHDGKNILFQGYKNGQSDIYSVNSLGGIPKNLTDDLHENHTPIFSPDYKFIYYSSNSSGNWEIWKMSLTGRSKVQVTENGGYAPQFLLDDSNKLFFVKNDEFGIWKLDLESNQETIEIQTFIPKNYGSFSLSDKGIYYVNPRNRSIDYWDTTSKENSTLLSLRPKKISPFGITLSYSLINNSLLYAQVDQIDSDIMLLKEQQ